MFRSSDVNRQLIKVFLPILALLMAVVVGAAPRFPFPTLRRLPFLIGGGILALFAVRWLGLMTLLYFHAAVIWLQSAVVGHILHYLGLPWLEDVELGIYMGALIQLASAYRPWQWRGARSLPVPLVVPLLVFATGGCMAFLTGLAPDRQLALYLLRTTCFYSLAIYFLVTSTVRQTEQAERLVLALCLGGCIVGLATYVGFVEAESTSIQRLGTSYQFGPFFGLYAGTGSLAAYMSHLLPLALSLGLNGRDKWNRALGLIACGALAISSVLAGGRTGWIAGALSCLLVIVLSVGRGHVGTSLAKLSLVLVLVLLLVVALRSGAIRLTPVIRQRMALASMHTVTADSSFLIHVSLWRTGVDLFKRNPWGMGFVFLLPGTRFNPHSLHVGLALGTGVIGLSGLAWFIALWLRRCVAALKLDDQTCRAVCTGALGSLLAVLINGIVHDTNLVYWSFAAVWVMLSAAMAAVQSSEAAKCTGQQCP